MAVRALVGAFVVGGALLAAGLTPSFAADDATVFVVQGLPGKTVNISVDGRTIATGVKSSVISGPFKIHSGSRTVKITGGGATLVSQTVSVKPGWNADVVVHLPADPNGKPLLTPYKNDLSAVPADKASLTVAHTAAVPPADITVDGKVLFRNIGNGESLHVVVPVATYSVAIVPTGKSKPVFFGPVDLTVQGGFLNSVYAIGNPASKTMNVVVHVQKAAGMGSASPGSVNTGTGGQAVGAQSVFLGDFAR